MSRTMQLFMYASLTLLPAGVIIVYGLVNRGQKQSAENSTKKGGYQEVYWQKLRDLDYRTGKMTKELESLNNQKVAIPGFVVPLDDNDKGLSEFLLVPSPKACIHVPAPPPNQMVMVRMKSGTAPKREWGPVWVKGILRIETAKSGFGDVSFTLLGEESERYQTPE